ncbi:hypothetical protein HJD18_09205 [Thermoleophilia bacterium SCSIO 60948]|nr:hypothetical protein HJD18_09205 [Thermoleophilia bacterium SCSIO 60948]
MQGAGRRDELSGLAAALGAEVEPEGSPRRATPALSALPRGPLPVVRGELDGRPAEAMSLGDSLAVLAYVPEVQAYTSQICCHDRDEVGRTRPASYPNEGWEEIRLESVAFERRYRLIVLRGQHGGWMRELFSPSLIAWLAEDAPRGLSFELNEGWVSVVVPAGSDPGATWRAAEELIARIRREALEEDAAPNLFDRDERERSLDRPLARVRWDSPPASPGAAAAAYRARARNRPSVLLAGAVLAVVLLPVGAGLGYLFGGIFGVLAGGAGALAIGWALGRELGSYRARFDGWNSGSLGAHAFMREYARSRGLERIDPARFHHDHRALPLPGRAECALAEPGGRRIFVMLSDAPELRASGAGSIDPSDRPFARDVMVAPLDSPATRTADLELPDGWRVDAYEPANVAISRPLAGNTLRSLDGCDGFRAKAGELIDRLA